MSRLGPYARDRWTTQTLDDAVRYLATAHRADASCEATRCLSMADFTRAAMNVLHREAAGRTLRNRLLATGRIERKVPNGRAACYVLMPATVRRVMRSLLFVTLLLP